MPSFDFLLEKREAIRKYRRGDQGWGRLLQTNGKLRSVAYNPTGCFGNRSRKEGIEGGAEGSKGVPLTKRESKKIPIRFRINGGGARGRSGKPGNRSCEKSSPVVTPSAFDRLVGTLDGRGTGNSRTRGWKKRKGCLNSICEITTFVIKSLRGKIER